MFGATMYAVSMSDPDSGQPHGTAVMDEPNDLLMRVAHSQDKSALAALFNLYGPRIKSMMLKLGASDALAEDLVQETFLSVWRKAGLFSSQRGAASTWIFTIARNLRIDQLRRQSNKPYEDLSKIELASDAPTGSFGRAASGHRSCDYRLGRIICRATGSCPA